MKAGSSAGAGDSVRDISVDTVNSTCSITKIITSGVIHQSHRHIHVFVHCLCVRVTHGIRFGQHLNGRRGAARYCSSHVHQLDRERTQKQFSAHNRRSWPTKCYYCASLHLFQGIQILTANPIILNKTPESE